MAGFDTELLWGTFFGGYEGQLSVAFCSPAKRLTVRGSIRKNPLGNKKMLFSPSIPWQNAPKESHPPSPVFVSVSALVAPAAHDPVVLIRLHGHHLREGLEVRGICGCSGREKKTWTRIGIKAKKHVRLPWVKKRGSEKEKEKKTNMEPGVRSELSESCQIIDKTEPHAMCARSHQDSPALQRNTQTGIGVVWERSGMLDNFGLILFTYIPNTPEEQVPTLCRKKNSRLSKKKLISTQIA